MKKDEIIWQNIERLTKQKGWSLVDLSVKSGTRPQTINSIKSGIRGVGATLLNRFSVALNVEQEELMKTPVPERIDKQIPVISWISAGQFTECADHWPAGTSGEGDPVTSTKKLNDNVFGLRIVGDSMLPRFMPGDVIVVDPSIHCDNGCRCVVKLNGEVTFKIFNENDTEIKLTSMNEKYPDIIIRKDSKVEFKVIGKVVDIIAKL